MSSGPLIQLERVTKTFAGGVKALDEVTLSFEAGTVTAILGPSGSGKSTLLRCINGLETPASGKVTVNQRPVGPKTLREVRSDVGMVFQHFNLVPTLNVLTNVLTGSLSRVPWFWSLLYAFPKEEIERAKKALAEVGLAEYAWQRADRLSGGQQQRVAIARSIMQRPKAILADEPVASLDPNTSEEIMRLLVAAAREHGIALVINLHQVELAKQYCERIVGLRKGVVVFDGAPSDFEQDAHHELYQAAVSIV